MRCQPIRVDENVLIIFTIPTLVMNVQQSLAILSAYLELYLPDAPDVLSVTDIDLLSRLNDLAWCTQQVLLFPLSVRFQALLVLFETFLTLFGLLQARDHLVDGIVNHLVLLDLLLPDVFPTHRASLNGSFNW